MQAMNLANVQPPNYLTSSPSSPSGWIGKSYRIILYVK